MNSKVKSRAIVLMAQSIDAALPCDGYGSVDEWKRRFGERLKDGGFTPDEIETRLSGVLAQAAAREDARTKLRAIIDTHTDGSEEGYNLVLTMLKQAHLFASIKPTRDLARLARHVEYFQRKSRTIRDVYRHYYTVLQGNAQVSIVQKLLGRDVKASDAFGKLYGVRLWRAADAAPYKFYERTGFAKCGLSGRPVPTGAGISVIANEQGTRKLVHPDYADTDVIVRDGPSGEFVLRDAVEWVTLDTGELAWRRHNEAMGAITFDEDEQAWVRLSARGAIAGYHSARRDWRGREGENRYRGCIGTELELGFKSAGQATKFLNRFVDDRGRFLSNRPFLVEHDGSLSRITGGMEIISEPLPLYEGYQAPNAQWRWLLEKLVQHGAEGWKHRAEAGIHVNLDVSDKTPNQIVRFVAFINNAASISRFVAGRKNIFGHTVGGSRDTVPDAELLDLKQFEDKDKSAVGGGYVKIDKNFLRDIGSSSMDSRAIAHFRGRGKYQPVHIRSGHNVLEVRIFGSNIRYEGFMACVEYCVAGMAFVCQLPDDEAVMAADISTQFRTWLSHNVAAYPNLASRIGVAESEDTVVARPLNELVA